MIRKNILNTVEEKQETYFSTIVIEMKVVENSCERGDEPDESGPKIASSERWDCVVLR